MILKFCICNDDPRKVNKKLTDVSTVRNAAIYQACSVMSPEFVVDYSESLLASNYIVASYGESVSKSYFIKEQIVIPGGRLILRCSIDVLNTWKADIWECTANVIRQEKEKHFLESSRFIYDTKMQGKVSTLVKNIGFEGNPLSLPDSNSARYLLTVLGGVHTAAPTPPTP